MVGTVTTQEPEISQKADCKNCLTRSCPMNGLDNSPVTSCSTFRLVNCAFCATKLRIILNNSCCRSFDD